MLGKSSKEPRKKLTVRVLSMVLWCFASLGVGAILMLSWVLYDLGILIVAITESAQLVGTLAVLLLLCVATRLTFRKARGVTGPASGNWFVATVVLGVMTALAAVVPVVFRLPFLPEGGLLGGTKYGRAFALCLLIVAICVFIDMVMAKRQREPVLLKSEYTDPTTFSRPSANVVDDAPAFALPPEPPTRSSGLDKELFELDLDLDPDPDRIQG